MNIIHLQRTSAFSSHDFEQCLFSIKPNDALVFIDDGCYNLNHNTFIELQKSILSVVVYHIQEHATARGVQYNNSQSTPISMNKLVELTFQYGSVITWQ